MQASADKIDLNAEVASAMPALLAKMREQLKDRMGQEAQGVAMRLVNEAVSEWAKEVLVPEVRAQLDAGKAGYVAMATDLASKLSTAMTDALVAEATKNLKQSWTLRKIAEELFR